MNEIVFLLCQKQPTALKYLSSVKNNACFYHRQQSQWGLTLQNLTSVIANDFVAEKENRKHLFGKFSANEIPNKFSISSKSTQTEN